MFIILSLKKKQLLVSLIFAIVFFVSISFISIMIFIISFLLLISVKGNYWNFLVLSLVTLCIKLLLLFSHPVVSNSLGSHGLQHVRPPCPSPSPGVFLSSHPLHWWCHPAISSSDAVFLSFCPQSLPASGTLLISQLFTSGDQNTGASASASVFPMNIQGWFPLRLTGLISLLSKGLSGVLALCLLYDPTLTIVCDYWEDCSLAYTDLHQQSDVSAFQHTV